MKKSLPRTTFKLFSLLFITILFASCGSYQQASYYEDDGIYSGRDAVTTVEKKSPEAVRIENKESDIYRDYFGQKAEEFGEILEDEIFTDVDSYYSGGVENDSIPLGAQTDYFADNNTYQGNPAWGDNPTNLTINVYDNWGWGGLGWGWGWNDPWLWNGWGWGGYGWGWGWNNPWR